MVPGETFVIIKSSLGCIMLPDMFYCLLWVLCGNLILLAAIEHIYIFRNLRNILYVIEPSDSLMREMTAPIAFSLQVSPVFVIISMRKALSLFYLCTEIITFPLKGRLSSFIVSGIISLPSKILH